MNISEKLLASPAGAQWQKIGVRNHHGVVIPLFSLHGKSSCGIGEYPDLIPIIDWCKEVGFEVVQLLPLNDTGQETSPYSALSAFALNPIHLHLDLPPQTELPQRIDYKSTLNQKDAFLRNYFALHGSEIMSQDDFRQFKEDQSFWLQDYAVFKALKIFQKWKKWEEWPQEFKNNEHLPPEIIKEAEYHQFVQFLCFQQFRDVKRYAAKNNIYLKGDIPILINRESADVWRRPELFSLEFSAGAPPDFYSKEGQNWGFPLYRWDMHEKENYHWWKERLHTAENFYDLYRVDHVVGFFRIWAIPLKLSAKQGFFFPQDNKVWIPQGEQIMRVMLKNSFMLPIGEDLGTVPPEVRECLSRLGICGTKVMRWERHWHGDQSFINPQAYPPESMTTVSTHDSETLHQWWKNQSQEAALYAQSQGWIYTPELSKGQEFSILSASHRSGSLFHINLLQEYLSLIPNLTWPAPEDERINVPGIISDKNWTYRFRPSIEEIIGNEELKQNIKQIIKSS
jgi:4-alpha-glucanotransferase